MLGNCFLGLGVKLLDSLNLGEAFNRKGCLFPISEDILHLLYSKGKELLLSLFILTADLSSKVIFSLLCSNCAEV